MRLQTYVARSGITSRRKAALLIEGGKVQINGRVVLEPGFPVEPDSDEVAYQGKKISFEKSMYLAFHKPKRVVTTLKDTHGRKTVCDFVPAKYRLFPVGRLDQDTTGLLILTNDGPFAFQISHPRFECPKVYEVTLRKPLDRNKIRHAEQGMKISSGVTSECRIESRGRRGSLFLYQVTLKEGKKRQIRYMMRDLGATLVTLHRTAIGPLRLGNLKSGQYRPLTSAEIQSLNRKTPRE